MRRLSRLLLVFFLTACSFERRPDRNGEGEPTVDRGAPGSTDTATDPAGTARQTLAVFREAVEVGDLSLALALLDREVEIVDDLVRRRPGPARELSRGEALLELRRLHGEGLVLEELGSELVLRQDAAVIHSRLAILHRGEDSAIAREVARGSETVFLVPYPEGWRIRLYHRSLDPPPLP